MLQIIFNEISAAEMSSLSTIDQLELLNQFKVSHEDLEQAGMRTHLELLTGMVVN